MMQLAIVLKMSHSRSLFSLFSSFQHLTVNMIILNYVTTLVSNHGPLVLEATDLPTEAQLAIIGLHFFSRFRLGNLNWP